jgi:hypothetical protein
MSSDIIQYEKIIPFINFDKDWEVRPFVPEDGELIRFHVTTKGIGNGDFVVVCTKVDYEGKAYEWLVGASLKGATPTGMKFCHLKAIESLLINIKEELEFLKSKFSEESITSWEAIYLSMRDEKKIRHRSWASNYSIFYSKKKKEWMVTNELFVTLLAMNGEDNTEKYFDILGKVEGWEVLDASDGVKNDTNKWQPIETAPKDGTPILGFAKCEVYNKISAVGVMATVAWFEDSFEKNGGYWDLCATGTYADDGKWYPELWMPLPQEPDLE